MTTRLHLRSLVVARVSSLGLAGCLLLACGDDAPAPAAAGGGSSLGGKAGAPGGAGGKAGGGSGGSAGASAGGAGAGVSGSSGHAGSSAGSGGSAGKAQAGSGGSGGAGGAGGQAGAGGDSGQGGVGGQGGESSAGSGGASAGQGGEGGSQPAGGAGSGGEAGSGAGSGGEGGSGGSCAGASGASGGEACAGLEPGPTGHLKSLTITSAGQSRGYSLDVPAKLDPSQKYPLVFVWHGDGGNGEGIRSGYDFASLAGNDAIFVYPDATAASGKSFDIESKADKNIDIALFDDLVASLSASYCVDPGRIFSAGMSRGGFFSNWLGCQRGDRLRAIAPHSGSIYSADNEYTGEGTVACPTPAPAAIVLHGESDNVVPFKDGQYALFQWTTSDGCGETTKPFAPSPCVAYDGCQAGHPVAWCAIPGLAHALWPKAAEATWAFFASLP